MTTGDRGRTPERRAEPPQATPQPNTLGPTAGGGALVRRGGPRADDPQERQRFVGRVLDLMLHAETSLLRRTDAESVAEAVRSVDAVKAMASFLGLSTVAAEAQGIEGRLRHFRSASAPLTEEDRGWLLGSIDRLRLLAVDPYRGPSAGDDALVRVSQAAIERLGAIVDDLAARVVGLGDPRLTALAAELCDASRALLLLPVRGLCQRLAADAGERSGGAVRLGLRGEDLAVPRKVLDALESVLPELVDDAIAACGARTPQLALVQITGYLVVRLSHEGSAPANVLDGLRRRLEASGGSIDSESDAQAGTLIVLRLPYG